MIQLGKESVNIGDKVLYINPNDSKSPKRLGVFESLYEGKMNVRFVSDNALETIHFNNLQKATPEVIVSYFKNRSKNELLGEVEKLNTALKEHGLKVNVEKIS